MSSNKRGRDSNSESSDDDAPIVQLSAAAVALQDAEWTKNLTAIDDVVKGVTSFCASMGCVCIARIRSSDKTRATIRCKHADKKKKKRACEISVSHSTDRTIDDAVSHRCILGALSDTCNTRMRDRLL